MLERDHAGRPFATSLEVHEAVSPTGRTRLVHRRAWRRFRALLHGLGWRDFGSRRVKVPTRGARHAMARSQILSSGFYDE